MKILNCIVGILILGFVCGLSNCTKCDNQEPRVRIVNNRSTIAHVQIIITNANYGDTNIDPFSVSTYKSYRAGYGTFNITVDTTTYQKNVQLSRCFDYDITIGSFVTVIATDRNAPHIM